MSIKVCRLIFGALIRNVAFVFTTFLIFQCASVAAAETLWFCDAPPCGRHKGAHSHGGPVEIRRGIYHKHLWLRLGNSFQDDDYVSPGGRFSPVMLLDTKGRVGERKIGLDKEHDLLDINFAMPEEGFYNVYVSRQQVNGGERRVQIAKAEVLKHSCREGHDNIQEKMPPRHNAAIALEIVRERLPKEDFHTRLGFGDTVAFLVLRNGRPQPDARVTLTTAQGWRKHTVSDDQGRVRYTMIRDYFPPWRMFNKRHAQPYLVKAEYSLPESGELDGRHYDHTRYCASFAGTCFPSRRAYASYAYGLMIGLFALVFSGLAVYLYRRRRIRPYREVCFDE
ncbi:MAG: hypothetical protein PVH87_18260 [Desulfobacteraceae bacterium]|jgi:hypothetical protein